MPTTTDKLLIAMAYSLYGEEQMDLLLFYLRCNGVDLCSPEVVETYLNLQIESKSNGYSSVIDYCEDLRYTKLIEEYKKCKDIYFKALEVQDEFSLSSSEEECSEIDQQYNTVINTPRKKEAKLVLGSFTIETLKVQNENQQQIEPKSINKNCKKVSIKEKKRFYWKLTEEEKAMDDHFDLLEEKLDTKSFTILTRINEFFNEFPPPGETKLEESTDEIIKNKFEEIVNKISQRKGEKNKGLWRRELRVLLEYTMIVVGYKNEFKAIYLQVETATLPQIILLILFQLQDLIFREENLEIICGVLKRHTVNFYDFYRK